ncbi:hypothetical protein ACFLV6_03510 [Chloroflexota bacterium]
MTEPFESLARTVATSEKFPHACFVTVPHPLGMLPASEVTKKADNVFPDLMKAATDWQPIETKETVKASCPAERFELTGTFMDINRHFLSKKWSLGLPVIPPTTESVVEMLQSTSFKPDEVLGLVPPQMGTLTIELAAVHAVMAGCRPVFFPLLIAALKGFMADDANWRGTLATTGTTQFIVIVNGPIVKEIDIAFSQGAAGKGHHANASIGYAINLIAYTVGGSRPPSIDRSTLASPSDYVCWVFGENEEALPSGWEPLHVERGFKSTDSVVTVMSSYPPVENIDHWSTSCAEHMRWWHYIVSPMHNMGGPCFPLVMEQNPIVAIGPEHVQLIASEGWSKNDFRQAFWERTQIPASAWPAGCPHQEILAAKYGPITADSLIPITHSPDQLLIVIAGGEGKHSHYFSSFPGAFPVSSIVPI